METQPAPVDETPRKIRRRGFLARFLRDRSGSTAIEFTMLAIPFSLLVFAILESCIAFAGQEVMANATDAVARQIRTGQIKAADLTAGMPGTNKLKSLICAQLEIVVANNCPGLLVDLRNFAKFSDAAAASLALASSLTHHTSRAGIWLAEVGPIFIGSQIARSSASLTGWSV